MKDYEKYDAVALAELVRTGEVTPAELVDAAIDRLDLESGIAENLKMRTSIRIDRCADDLGHGDWSSSSRMADSCPSP